MRKLLYSSILVFSLSILFTPRVPFQDYPDWIYQAKVFKELITSNAIYNQEYSMRPPVIPNSAVTVIMGLTNMALSPDLSGRIMVIIDFLLVFWALKRCLRVGETNEYVAAAIAMLFASSIYFFYGFLSFNLGLGLFFIVSLNPLKTTLSWRKILLYALIFLGLYYIHFIILLMTVSTMLAFRIILKKENYPLVRDIVFSLIPAVVLYILYLLGPAEELRSQTIWKYNLAGKFMAYLNSLSVFYRFNDFASSWELILIESFNILLISGFILFLYPQIKGRLKNVCIHDYSIIGYAFWIGALLTPFQIAGFGYKGDRFFWVGFIFVILSIMAVSKPFSRVKTRLAVIFITLIMLGKALTILLHGYDDYNVESQLKSVIPPNTEFSSYMVKFDYPEYYPDRGKLRTLLDKSCPAIITADRIPVYLYLERNQFYKGIFKTGIIKLKSPECEPIKFLKGDTSPQLQECRNLLFMSPGGIGGNLIELANSKLANMVIEKEYLFVSAPHDW